MSDGLIDPRADDTGYGFDANIDFVDPRADDTGYGDLIPKTDPTPGIDWGKVGGWLKNVFTGKGSAADYGTLITGLGGLYETINRQNQPKVWKGKVQKAPIPQRVVSQDYKTALNVRPYGAAARGRNPFSYTAPQRPSIYLPKELGTLAAKDKAALYSRYRGQGYTDKDIRDAVEKQIGAQSPEAWTSLRTLAGYKVTNAEGGIIGLAGGGYLEEGAFVLPADVVSHFGNGSSSAGLAVVQNRLGAQPVQGPGDGMSDSIPTTIAGQQPARVANDEAVIPRAQVARIGGGDVDRGAQVLYDVMNNIRKARTGTTKQGKKINPDKFMPGGIASLAGGGAIAFEEGGATGGDGGVRTGTPSDWVGEYIAGPDGYLSKAWSLAEEPYEAYEGPLTAGLSPTQNTALSGFQGLTAPTAMTDAATTAGGIATKLKDMPGYTGTTFTNQFTKPTDYTPGQFKTDFSYLASDPTKFTNQFTAPDTYKGFQFDTGLGPIKSVQDYMSPYTSSVTDIAAREARREADVSRTAEQARLSKAGAFGGSRQAIMEAERQRNVGQQIGDIRTKGLQDAYDRALAQRTKEAEMGLDAQKATELSRQFGAKFGMEGQELQARYGLDAQKAQELARQFNEGKRFDAAKLRAEFGLDAQKAAELSKQFAAQQGMRGAELEAQYGLDALKAQEQSKQFGATQDLNQLQAALRAAGLQSEIGQAASTADIARLKAMMEAGGIEQAAEQAAIDAEMKQWQEGKLWPYRQLEFQQKMLQGLPISSSMTAPNTSMFSDLIGGIGQLMGLYKDINAATPD